MYPRNVGVCWPFETSSFADGFGSAHIQAEFIIPAESMHTKSDPPPILVCVAYVVVSMDW